MKKNIGYIFMIIGLVIGIFSLSFFISYDRGKKASLTSDISKENIAEIKILSEDKLKELDDAFFEISKDMDIAISQRLKVKNIIFNFVGMKNSVFLENINLDDLKKNEVIIGKGLDNLTYEKDDKKILNINNEEYKVKEVLNENNCAFSAFLPLDIYMDTFKDSNTSNFNAIFLKDRINEKSIIDKIEGLNLKSGKIFSVGGDDEVISSGIYIIIIILAISFINVCNFSLLWMTKRRKEITVYKALGATNLTLFKILFFEILLLSCTAMVISGVLQVLINYYLNSRALIGAYLWIGFDNLIKCSIAVFILSLLSALPSYLTTVKIQPVNVLKE